jgi:hypothetical protein
MVGHRPPLLTPVQTYITKTNINQRMKRKIIYGLTFLITVFSLFIGIIFLKENLLAPAIISLFIISYVLLSSKNGPGIKTWLCWLICAGLLIDTSGIFLGHVHYTDLDWIDFILSAPSFVMAGMGIIILLIGYSNLNLDRLLFSLFTIFSTLCANIVYAVFFVIRIDPTNQTSEKLMTMNYYLNAQSFTILMVCLLTILMANYIMINKELKLITAETVMDGYQL